MKILSPEELETWMFEDAKAGGGKLIVIPAQPRSKANSRRIVGYRTKKGKWGVRSIKSQKALDFVDVAKSCNLLYGYGSPYTEDVAVYALLAYESRRSDVDESLVLDVLQGVAYENDRSVRRKYIVGTIDKNRPRATIYVKKI